MQQKTTPADRAKALLSKFGDVYYPAHYHDGDDAFYVNTIVDGLVIYVDVSGHDMSVSVYDLDVDGPRRTLLRLSGVRDDDLVASIIQQVIDHHNGKQVV